MAVTVSGFTTAAIHSAAQSAGEGGEVLFPAGTYDSDGLTASVAYQTWRGVRPELTIIKRTAQTTAADVLNVTAAGFRLRDMALDGNRANNDVTASGLRAMGYDLDLENVHIVNTKHYGITQSDAALHMDKCLITGTGQNGIFWRITTGGVSRQAPQIYRSTIDRGNGADYLDGGCIAIICPANKKGTALRIRDNKLICFNPGGNPNNSGGLGVFAVDYLMASGNEIVGGRMAISINNCDFAVIDGNPVRASSSYHFELVQSDFVAVGLNPIRGPGGQSRGIENNASNHSRLISNPNAGVGSDVRISRGCFGVYNRDN